MGTRDMIQVTVNHLKGMFETRQDPPLVLLLGVRQVFPGVKHGLAAGLCR